MFGTHLDRMRALDRSLSMTHTTLAEDMRQLADVIASLAGEPVDVHDSPARSQWRVYERQRSFSSPGEGLEMACGCLCLVLVTESTALLTISYIPRHFVQAPLCTSRNTMRHLCQHTPPRSQQPLTHSLAMFLAL